MNTAKTVRLLAACGLIAASSVAVAGGVHWSVNIGTPGVYYAPAPVYVQPQPVYVQPQPVYVQPPPTYLQPAPVYVPPTVYYYNTPQYRLHPRWHHGHGHHGHRHHR